MFLDGYRVYLWGFSAEDEVLTYRNRASNFPPAVRLFLSLDFLRRLGCGSRCSREAERDWLNFRRKSRISSRRYSQT
jgi:hypothetical protein